MEGISLLSVRGGFFSLVVLLLVPKSTVVDLWGKQQEAVEEEGRS